MKKAYICHIKITKQKLTAMKATLKSLCTLSILRDIEKYGAYKSFAEFAKTSRDIIVRCRAELSDGCVSVFESNEQVSDILTSMDILGIIEEMEADGVLNRKDYIRHGFFFAASIESDVESISMYETHKEQMARIL